jgi:Ca2+-binding EF-hand superfamily protein
MRVIKSVTSIAIAATLLAAPATGHAQGRGRGAAKHVGAEQRPTEPQNHQMQERFRGMDVNNDGVITRDEWRGNDESFRQHDTNHDGVLSGEEVWVPVAAQGNAADRSRVEELTARFERLDTNLDDRISFAEFTGSRQMFERMDRNHDGFVSREEFMTPLSTSTPAVSRESQVQTRAYQSGYQKGLDEGREAGREDKNVNGGKWDLDGQRELEQADSGYRAELGARSDYQAGYRAGFRIGYRDGFGPRR